MKDDISGLLDDISRQRTDFITETIRITGVAPVARARNDGAKQAKGDILIFIDCDIRLGNEFYLANLVKLLDRDKTLGAVCASLRLPPDASGFQRLYARQIAHYEMPIVGEETFVDMVPSACFAISREFFLKIGLFDEKIIRGEDSELSFRIKKAGARMVLAPQAWCYHPAPDNLGQLAGINFRNGKGVCFVDSFYPKLNVDVHPQGILYASQKITLAGRIKRFAIATCRALVEFKVLALLARFFYVGGYLWGLVSYRMLKRR